MEDEVLGHVLRSRIECNNDEAARSVTAQWPQQRVFVPDEEPVVPVLLDPVTQPRLNDAEVDDAANAVQALRHAIEMDAVVVPVQVCALALVPDHTVATADVVVTPDAIQGH